MVAVTSCSGPGPTAWVARNAASGIGRRIGACVAALCVLLVSPGLAHAQVAMPVPAPQRIVSLNLCIDQILIDLVPKNRIAAITHLGADPAVSAIADRLAGLPTTRGAAEEVLALRPDLVLAGPFTTPTTVDLLRRLGQRVEIVPMPQSLREVREIIALIARFVAAPERGGVVIAEFDRRLTAAIRSPQTGNRALIYQINSFVASGGGLMDEVLMTAGWQNVARLLPTGGRGQTTLETLITAAPDLLVLTAGPDDYRTAVADNLRHPSLERLRSSTQVVQLPWRDMLCGTQHIARVIERLAAIAPRP